MRGLNFVLPALVVGAVSGAALGSNWMERPTASPAFSNHAGVTPGITFGDAGETLAEANFTLGVGPLDFITGTLAARQRPQPVGTLRSLDADIYCISITDAAGFSAIASGTDTNLSLFNSSGVAVAFNDNRTDSATSTGSRLIANGFLVDGVTPTGIPGLTTGLYFLAISRVDGSAAARRQSRPLDAGGALIFPGMVQNGNEGTDPNAFTRRADLGPIAPGTVLSSWELFATTAAPFNANYTIALTGVSYHEIPAPGAAGVLGLAGLVALRRRR